MRCSLQDRLRCQSNNEYAFVLYRMSDFMRRDSQGGDTLAVVDLVAQAQRAVARIVMIREMPAYRFQSDNLATRGFRVADGPDVCVLQTRAATCAPVRPERVPTLEYLA